MANSSKTCCKLTIPLLLLLTISFSAAPANAKYGGGTGEPNDPYLIYDANQMNAIGADSNDWDKHFKLVADIDLSGFAGTSFNIIGYCVGLWEDDKPFTGVFDGNGHTISNFSYTSTDRNYIGIFAYVNDFEAAIKDLGLIDPDVDAGTGCFVGSLVGWFRGGTITDCYVDGAAVAGTEGVGGLVGQNGICYHADECHGGKMSNCYSTGSVSGYWAVGGLVGKSNGGTIYNCYSESVVSGTTGVGGLMGDNEEGAIFNSYSHSDVSGNEQVGGLLGSNYWGTVTSSYSTGGVSGDDHVGGLAGYNSGGGFASSFWDIETGGPDNGIGTPLPTKQMQMASTFIDAGWDFVGKPDGPHDVWAEPVGGGYPILCWQLPPFFGLPGFSGGSGTTDDPYLISTADELNSIGHNPRLMAAHFKLIDDIDLTGTDLFLIGSELFPFRGVFDGNGRKISNFTYSSTDADKIGLFRYVYGENAIIKNLGLIDPDIDVGTGYYLGSLVGQLFEGKVTNCYVESGSVSGNFCVGGLMGANNRGTLTNCHATGEVSGYFYVGGLLGQSYYGTINNCDSEADVYGGSYAGGLVGYNDFGSTINNCHTTGTVSGDGYVGGLVGYNFATITNCHTTGTVSGSGSVGGLAGSSSYGKITNCYATGEVRGGNFAGGLVGDHSATMTNCYAAGDVRGEHNVGGLAGRHSHGTINNCYATGDASGTGWSVGGLVGQNHSGTISNCYAKGGAAGNMYVGGLTGWNREGTITDCYSTGGVSGTRSNVGGLVGSNYGDGTINNCYSTGIVAGNEDVGGLAGSNSGTITNCYSTGGVSGHYDVGGFVGDNYYGIVSASFWDIETSGQTTSDGGTGLPTAEMQTISTFTDAGWDFVGEVINGPNDIWTICESEDYPRLWWELAPVLHAEPEVTLGTSNTISWDPVPGANDYYAECAEDANFTTILSNTGWITETSYEFTGLKLGKRYWYSVKARNIAGVETNWSNVESSLQGTLADAVEAMLDPDTVKNKNMKNALLNKIDAALKMIEEGNYTGALSKLEHDILAKMNGCGETGEPDKNDWIITCEGQSVLYPLVIETIEHVKSLMD